MLIDSHAHLNNPRLSSSLEHYLQAAHEAGVTRIINVGYDLASSRAAVQQAEAHKSVFAAVGLHPHDAKAASDSLFHELEVLAKHPRVVAWGEIGLDYHYNHSPQEVQREAFRHQLRLAKALQLPVIVHNRDAHHDVLEILRAEAPFAQGGVMHCYSASAELLDSFLELGMYISLAGPVTFNNARRLHQVAAKVPLDCLLVETDCPYLTPEPYRGKLNHPALVHHVVAKIAAIKELSVEFVAQVTAQNAESLFRLRRERNEAN